VCYFNGKNKYKDEIKKLFRDYQVTNDAEVKKAFFNRMILVKEQLEEQFNLSVT
jgi:hypothetical protein